MTFGFVDRRSIRLSYGPGARQASEIQRAQPSCDRATEAARQASPRWPGEACLRWRTSVLGAAIGIDVDVVDPPVASRSLHHERYDGAGYPDGLAGEEIPVGARVIAACDAFNAMTTDRPYRKAMPISDALAELRSESGKQFDPDVVAALVGLVESWDAPGVSTGA